MNFAEIAYSYFGMVEEIEITQRSINSSQHLTNKFLSANRLLMADILYLDTSEEGYRYNHGRNSWSYEVGDRPIVRSPNPEATGRNQLFGDGHVGWKKIPLGDNLPTHKDRFREQWNGAESGWVSQYDTSYY
jgi:prepilin-type processing-associated H-X9-DG protein